MLRHLSVLFILTGLAYLMIRFAGLGGRYMVVVPSIFIIYLGVISLIGRSRKGKAKL